jgi:hypothetical protein
MQRKVKSRIGCERAGLKRFAGQMLRALKDQPDPIAVAEALAQIAPELQSARERRRCIATRIALLAPEPKPAAPKLRLIHTDAEVKPVKSTRKSAPIAKIVLPDTDFSGNGMPEDTVSTKAPELTAPPVPAKKKKEPMAALSLDAAAGLLAAFNMPDPEVEKPSGRHEVEQIGTDDETGGLTLPAEIEVEPKSLERTAPDDTSLPQAESQDSVEESAERAAPARPAPPATEAVKARRAGSSRIISADPMGDVSVEKTTSEEFIPTPAKLGAKKMTMNFDLSALSGFDEDPAATAEALPDQPASEVAAAPEPKDEADPIEAMAAAAKKKPRKAKMASDMSALADLAADDAPSAKPKPGFDLSALSQLGDATSDDS